MPVFQAINGVTYPHPRRRRKPHAEELGAKMTVGLSPHGEEQIRSKPFTEGQRPRKVVCRPSEGPAA